MLKHGLLGLINYSDMTGYEIMELFRDSLNYFWNAQTSQIYRELQALEKNGWATSQVLAQQGKPDKRIYSITEAGKEELSKWLDQYEFKPRNYPVLLKAFFLGELTPEENLSFFEQYRAFCVRKFEELNKPTDFIHSVEETAMEPKRSLYWAMTLDYGVRETQMQIAWCDACIQKINEQIAMENRES